MTNIDENWLQEVAASINLPSLSPSVCRTLLPVIEAHIRQLIQQSYKFTRKSHSKTLTVEDFNLALFSNKLEPIYGLTNSYTNKEPVQSSAFVNLTEFASTPLPPIPLKPQIHLHWLVVNGRQPMIAENPSISSKSSVGGDDLKPMSLPKEMQQLYQRVTGILLASDNVQALNAVFRVFRDDAGLQELVPYFSRFFYQQIKANTKRLSLLTVIVKSIHELLLNPNIGLDFHLQQLLPAIFSCTVAAKLSYSSLEDHWALRRKAALVIAMICAKYGESYPDLHARVCKTYLDAIAPDKSLGTVYGGLVGLSALGQSVLRSVLLPSLAKIHERLCDSVSLPTVAKSKKDGGNVAFTSVVVKGEWNGDGSAVKTERGAHGSITGETDLDKERKDQQRSGKRATNQIAVLMCRQALCNALGLYIVRCMRLPTITSLPFTKGRAVSSPQLSDLEEMLVPFYASVSKDCYYCRTFI